MIALALAIIAMVWLSVGLLVGLALGRAWGPRGHSRGRGRSSGRGACSVCGCTKWLLDGVCVGCPVELYPARASVAP